MKTTLIQNREKFKNNLNKIYKYLMFHNRCYLDPTQISKGVT